MVELSLNGLSILVLEDESLLRKQIAAHLERLGADVSQAGTIAAAEKMTGSLNFDFAFLDVNLPDGLGTDFLKNKALPSGTGVIVMSANADISGAVAAMKMGALDYLAKPVNPAELAMIIGRARKNRQSARLEEQRREITRRAGETFFFGQALAALQKQMDKILEVDARLQHSLPPVLIQGETGTGKTTIARILHQRGPRALEPLVEVNCSALPESLAEAELFGHERGAFTDAKTGRMGLFEAANGGTLFLDELASLPLAVQAKVLTAIEDRNIRRVGGNKSISIDVRVIAAANRPLSDLMAEGRFREDLYHRLDLFRIAIPALRERGPDIIKLAEMMAKRGFAIAIACRFARFPNWARASSRLIAGPATCANSSMNWSGRLCSRKARNSISIICRPKACPTLPMPARTAIGSTRDLHWSKAIFCWNQPSIV